jgi:class 3 adenylate cyclase
MNKQPLLTFSKIVSLILISFILILVYQIESKEIEYRRNDIRLELQQQIPLMQERCKLGNIALEKTLINLRNMDRFNQQNMKLFINEMQTIFGKKISCSLWTPDFISSQCYNISKAKNQSFGKFLNLLYLEQTSKNLPGNQNQQKELKEFFNNFLEENFSSSPNKDTIPNYLTHLETRFAGEDGILLIGNLLSPELPKNIKGDFSRKPKRIADEIFDQNLTGSVFLFIPIAEISSLSWINSNINKSTELSNFKIKIGTRKQLLAQETLPDEILKSFKVLSTRKPQGSFITSNYAYAFLRIDLGLENQKEQTYGIYSKKLSVSHSRKSYLIVLLLLVLTASIFHFLLKTSISRSSNWNKKLTHKFVFLGFFACFLPILVLIYQAQIRLKNNNRILEQKAFLKTTKRLEDIETAFKHQVGDILLTLKTFQEICDNDEEFEIPIVRERVRKLKKYHASNVYYSTPDGATKFIEQEKQSNSKKERRRILKLVLKFLHASLKFTSPKNETKIKTDDILIESVTTAAGPDMLLKTALGQDTLIPFRIFSGSVWLYSHFKVNQIGKRIRHYMMIIYKKHLVRKFIQNLQEEVSSQETKIVFMPSAFELTEKLFPTWVETQPTLISLLRHLNKLGGKLSLKLNLTGKNYICSGRKLKNLDWAAIALTPIKEQKYDSLMDLLIITCIFPLILTILIAINFRFLFLKPIGEMQKSVESIANGNYDHKISYSGNDELADLCQNFNKMGASLKEKEFLSRFLSDIAQSAVSGKIETKATSVSATILFSDIRSFTTLTEEHPPEQIVEMLNDYMTEMEMPIEQQGGTIEKFIGDAIMAVFLPEIGKEHHTIRAIKAAKGMFRKLQAFNKSRAQKNLFQIQIGAGIATGPVLMGTLGNKEGRQDFTITGSTVNIAANMEKISKYGKHSKIVLSQTALEIAELKHSEFTKITSPDKQIIGAELIEPEC